MAEIKWSARRLFKIELLSWWVETLTRHEARRLQRMAYATDERQSRPGWIGIPTGKIILNRLLTLCRCSGNNRTT